MPKIRFLDKSEGLVEELFSYTRKEKGKGDIPGLAKSFYGFLRKNEILDEMLKDKPDFKFISKCLNVNLLFEFLPKGLSGFPFKMSDEYFIVINEILDSQKRLQLFFHEFFHISLGDMSDLYIPSVIEEEYNKDKDQTHYHLSCLIMKRFKLVSILSKKQNDFLAARGPRPVISLGFKGSPILSKKKLQALHKNFIKILKREITDMVRKEDEIIADRLTEETLKLIRERKDAMKNKRNKKASSRYS